LGFDHPRSSSNVGTGFELDLITSRRNLVVGYRLDPTPLDGSVLGVEFLGGSELNLVEELVHSLVVGLPIEQVPVAERTKTVACVLFHGDGVTAHRGYSSRLFTVLDVSGCAMALTLGGYKSGPQLPAQLYARG
jgi:hypothetical protein